MIARNTITTWVGACGSAKSYLGLSMAVAVASGGVFLGRRCQKASVLYLDFENPGFVIKERLELMAGAPIDNLHIWGTWLDEQPLQIGSDLLLTIAKESKPLIVVDPLRYAHGAEENDSTEMSLVMNQLKLYAAAGCAVVVMHHPGKAEGSWSRGSSVIRDHSDVCFLHELSPESGLITITYNKQRTGGEIKPFTVRPNFEDGTFEVCNSPEFTKWQEDVDKIARLIEAKPGLSQNELTGSLGMKKERARELVKSQTGLRWQARTGPRNSLLYFPLDCVPELGTSGNQLGRLTRVPFFLSIGEKREPVSEKPDGKTLPSCPVCGGFAVDSRTNTCFKCEAEGGGRVQ